MDTPRHTAITGASSGIGVALARAFAAAGHRLTLLARRVDQLEQLARELREEHDRPDDAIGWAACDLSRLDGCTDWIAEAEAARGPFDTLVNNAGIQLLGDALDLGARGEGHRLMTVDLLAPLALIDALGPAMVERGAGAIVNVSSLVAAAPLPGMAHYNAAKSALAAYSEDLRLELRPHGVHVLTVYPGPVQTPMADGARERLDDTLVARWAPVGRPERLARAVLRALRRRRARVLYPWLYAPSFWTPRLSTWFSRLLAPRLRGRSPARGGDA